MSGARVSVVVTSHDQQAYLIEAIDSVLGQTRAAYEIVVVDDASSDGSQELIRAYERRHPGRVRGLLQERNAGIPRTRSLGLTHCTGDCIAVLDGDDRLLPGFVASMAAALERTNDTGCVYGNVNFIDSNGRYTGTRDAGAQPEGDILAHVAAGAMGLLRCLLARRDLVEAAGLLDERFPKFDGFVLTLRLAQRARFAYVAEPTAEYRVHAGGDSRTIQAGAMVEHLEAVRIEAQAACAGLPPALRAEVARAWSHRLLEWRVESDLARGRRLRALARLGRAALTDHQVLGLARDVLRARYSSSRPVNRSS